MLETRDVPAMFSWVGAGNFDNPSNWASSSSGIPQAGDDIEFLSALSGDCTNMHGPAGGGAYNRVAMTGGYAGTVTLSSAFTTATLDIQAAPASISQPVAGTDITVTSLFNWNRGTLNSSTYHSKVIVTGSGATATIAPHLTGTVTTGSTLWFGTGASANFNSGTVHFENNAGVNVEAGATAVAAPPAPSPRAKFTTFLEGSGTVTVKGTQEVGGFDSQLAFLNDGGVIKVTGDRIARVTARLAGPYVIPNQSVFQVSGTLMIENGSTLEATNGVGLVSGKLSTKSGGLGGSDTATIRGDLKNGVIHFSGNPLTPGIIVTGADVVIGDSAFDSMPGLGHQFGILYIEGNANWVAGTYRPVIKGPNPGTSDLWKVRDTFTISSLITITPRTVDAMGQPTAKPPAGLTWTILSSDAAVVGATPQNQPDWVYTQGGGATPRFWHATSK